MLDDALEYRAVEIIVEFLDSHDAYIFMPTAFRFTEMFTWRLRSFSTANQFELFSHLFDYSPFDSMLTAFGVGKMGRIWYFQLAFSMAQLEPDCRGERKSIWLPKSSIITSLSIKRYGDKQHLTSVLKLKNNSTRNGNGRPHLHVPRVRR